MAFPVSTRSTGDLVTAAIWNADVKDNMNTLQYAFVPPKNILATSFETSARFTTTLTSAGAGNYGTSGLELDTSATISSAAKVVWLSHIPAASGGLFNTFPLVWGVTIEVDTVGTDAQAFFGLGSVTVAGSGITFTDSHIGFKIVRAASGANNLFATVAGGTETASSSLTTLAAGNGLDLSLRVNSASSVEFWYRKANGSWSSATTLTTNIPTGNSASTCYAVTNAGVATRTRYFLGGSVVVV